MKIHPKVKASTLASAVASLAAVLAAAAKLVHIPAADVGLIGGAITVLNFAAGYLKAGPDLAARVAPAAPAPPAAGGV